MTRRAHSEGFARPIPGMPHKWIAGVLHHKAKCRDCGDEAWTQLRANSRGLYVCNECRDKIFPIGRRNMTQSDCIKDCHKCCCDCITDLESVRDQVNPDVQAVIDRCIAACRACCGNCAGTVKGLPATP